MVKTKLRILPLLLLLAPACDEPLTEIIIECQGEGVDGNSCSYACDENSECIVQVEVNLEGGDSDHDDDGGGTGASGSEACSEFGSPAFEDSLLDHANCYHGLTDELLGSCSGSERLFRPCDAHFVEWCGGQGGDIVSCDAEELSQAQPQCGNGPAFGPCDSLFTDACDTLDRGFLCYAGDSDGCTTGACPEIAEAGNFCCGNCTDQANGDTLCTGCSDQDETSLNCVGQNIQVNCVGNSFFHEESGNLRCK